MSDPSRPQLLFFDPATSDRACPGGGSAPIGLRFRLASQPDHGSNSLCAYGARREDRDGVMLEGVLRVIIASRMSMGLAVMLVRFQARVTKNVHGGKQFHAQEPNQREKERRDFPRSPLVCGGSARHPDLCRSTCLDGQGRPCDPTSTCSPQTVFAQESRIGSDQFDDVDRRAVGVLEHEVPLTPGVVDKRLGHFGASFEDPRKF